MPQGRDNIGDWKLGQLTRSSSYLPHLNSYKFMLPTHYNIRGNSHSLWYHPQHINSCTFFQYLTQLIVLRLLSYTLIHYITLKLFPNAFRLMSGLLHLRFIYSNPGPFKRAWTCKLTILSSTLVAEFSSHCALNIDLVGFPLPPSTWILC